MTDNVGLSTPRGSGTSGYVQRNLSALKPRHNSTPYSRPSDISDMRSYRQRQPDAEILEHERRRAIEVQVFELRDQLEDEGADEDDIDAQSEALRRKLQAEYEKSGAGDSAKGGRGLKGHQVHELARAKIEESERLRKALGIKEDYEEGSHWRRQEEREKGRREGVEEGTRDQR